MNHPCDGRTDGQMDGIAIAYARLAYMLSRTIIQAQAKTGLYVLKWKLYIKIQITLVNSNCSFQIWWGEVSFPVIFHILIGKTTILEHCGNLTLQCKIVTKSWVITTVEINDFYTNLVYGKFCGCSHNTDCHSSTKLSSKTST